MEIVRVYAYIYIKLKIEITFSPVKSVLMHKQSMLGGREGGLAAKCRFELKYVP